jgi:threonine/homoserine/homoserine lactone efflux protein
MPSVEFLLTSLVVVLVPGTGVLYTVSTGLTRGWRASVHAALGCTAGIVPHLLATVLGLAALMHASALAFQLLKLAGVAYLLYLAVVTWRDRSALALDHAAAPAPAAAIAIKAFLLNILNPKLTLFFLAFLPQFIEPDAAHPLARLLELSGVFMAMTFVVFVGYGCAADALRRRVIGSAGVQRWLRRGFAAAFAALGAKLAIGER